MALNRKKRNLLFAVAASILLLIIIISIVSHHESTKAKKFHGAVVSNGAECAEIGSAILKQGGSAADSAIATLFCEGVTCPQSMGLGGGFLMVMYNKATRKAEFLNARETAPNAATKDMFVNNPGASSVGGLSIAVPGELKGYWELHQKYGKLEWRKLVEPTIKLCREGHLVTPYLARIFSRSQDKIMQEPSLREIYVDPVTNATYKEGEKIKRLKLAESLEIIAKEGVDALYSRNGSLFSNFINDIKNFGGIITEDDMLNYKPQWHDVPETFIGNNRNYSLFASPLPGSGSLLSFIFNVLNGLHITDSPESWAKIIETFKFAYGLRTKLGDPGFVDGLHETLNDVMSEAYADKIREKINQNYKTNDTFEYYGAEFEAKEDHGTAHVSVLHENGDSIAVTSTINYLLGSMRRSQSTGIILNDEMDDFSTPGQVNAYGLAASPANFIKPGKRPLSSMTPTIITDRDGNVRLSMGAAGGAKITLSLVNFIIYHLYFNESVNEAIDHRRIYHLLSPPNVQYERGFDKNVLDELVRRGHNLQENPPEFGFTAITVISKKGSQCEAVFDPRRGGSSKCL
ncbi:scoloptoxin SSD14-like [Culicoides brevitarsis]|uniref:scoloptoxin SSD14-like n=1 Tax=Culicoides brevitarsis TaxID=469753 RepID=UPI00307C4B75